MTIRYVGPGGADGNTGLSWAQRKLTLNGVEDTPIVAGDIVHVGPGVYREMLTCDVSGAAGNLIAYIADVYGEHTDGVGGVVRITGSDNDQTAARNYCIYGNAKNYRTFQGFALDITATNYGVYCTGTGQYWTLQDIFAQSAGMYFDNGDAKATIQRCVIIGHQNLLNIAGNIQASTTVVRNCLLIGATWAGGSVIVINQCGGIALDNITLIGGGNGIYVITLPVGYSPVTVNHSIIAYASTGLRATVLGELVENYNCVYGNGTARTTVGVGAQSNAYPPLFEPPLLSQYHRPMWNFGELSQWSQVARIAGDGTEATDDLYGITKPVTAGKRSWGAIQYRPAIRDAATTYNASAASLELPDAGEHALQFLSQNVATVVTCRVYREANYAGTNPQLIVRQAGQVDTTVTDVGAAGAWNLLTANVVPAASPDWCSIILKSNNTAAAGAYATYFDAVAVDNAEVVGELDYWKSDRIAMTDVAETAAAGGGGAVTISPAEGGMIG